MAADTRLHTEHTPNTPNTQQKKYIKTQTHTRLLKNTLIKQIFVWYPYHNCMVTINKLVHRIVLSPFT